MKISTKGRYALAFMLDLAQQDPETYVSLKDVASRIGVTVKYLEQIVSALSKSGYLVSLRGSSGGYRLTKKPSEYTVGSILRSTEGSLAPITCLEEGHTNSCPLSRECTVLPFWKGLDEVVNNYVDNVTLQDILDSADSPVVGCGMEAR